jgi:DNA-binding protein H-NS
MQKDVAKAISTYEDRQKAEARAKVEALARDLGYSLAELVGTETKSSRAPAAAKYRHPENPALTWSGRGRKPQWFVEALEAGKTASELVIIDGCVAARVSKLTIPIATSASMQRSAKPFDQQLRKSRVGNVTITASPPPSACPRSGRPP